MRWHGFLLLALLTGVTSAQGIRRGIARRPNVVLVVLDDMGVDKIGAYGEGPPGAPPPCTPNLDALAASGVLFRNAWSNPTCSPTRAQILTGRHGFRTGIGAGIPPGGMQRGLNVVAERLLPRVLIGYDSSAVGKWHLMSPTNGSTNDPLRAGFRHYSGSLFNLSEKMPSDPICTTSAPLGYSNWIRYADNGGGTLVPSCYSGYATTTTADEAIARAQTMKGPWLLYVAFNAAHFPFEAPPTALCDPLSPCSPGHCPPASSAVPDVADAMIEVLDAEFGRMLAGIRAAAPDAYVFVIGDNGTDGQAARGTSGGCFDPVRSKGTVYEASINVPLLVAGPGVVPGECPALVSATDLFATLCELALIRNEAEDSVSLLPYLRGNMTPRRATVYSEIFSPNQPSQLEGYNAPPERHARIVRDERYKLVRYTDGTLVIEEFYDLATDPCETLDLCPGLLGDCPTSSLSPEAEAHYLALRAELVRLGVD